MTVLDKINDYLNEDVYDAVGTINKSRVTKPMSAKSEQEAIKKFENFVKGQQKLGHLAKGKLTDVAAKKA